MDSLSDQGQFLLLGISFATNGSKGGSDRSVWMCLPFPPRVKAKQGPPGPALCQQGTGKLVPTPLPAFDSQHLTQAESVPLSSLLNLIYCGIYLI